MDSIIQKASKGNRTALTQLYEGNKQDIYFLCRALLRNSEATIPAAKWSLKSAFQAVARGEVQTEEAFSVYAVKQAVSYCKKDITKKDVRAFKLPPQKNFRISHVNEHYIDANANVVDNYIHCLPAAQRFALVLRLIGVLSDNQIARVIGLDIGSADLLKAAEAENLGKVYRALRAKEVFCFAPTMELLTMAFDDALAQTHIPDELEKYITDYINTVSAPAEAVAKSKRKIYYMASAVVVAVAIILIVALAGGNNDTAVDEDDIAGTVTSTDTELTDTDADLDNVLNEATTDAIADVESTDEDEAYEDSETDVIDESDVAALDISLIYYADIEIQDYGTITVQLDQASAPITAANFVYLAESGFYDGLTFHRIIEGFMMQGGDPEGNGTGGSDKTIVGEFTDNGHDNALSHTRGAISMARSSDYDSASSQFFIVHEDSSASLDGQYAVFGYVTEGMDVVDAVCESAEPTDSNGTIAAEEQPVITSVTIRTETAS